MSDLLDRIRGEIQARLDASRAAVAEYERLEAALRALSDTALEAVGEDAAVTISGRKRAPRGANRAAVLAAVHERSGASPAEIAAASRVKKSIVYGELGRLVHEGLVVKRELPSGRTGYGPCTQEAGQESARER